MDQITRKIIHVDMDAFYASVEERDFPQYRGKPLAVGYPGKRSVVSTANYAARKYGVHSAMPSIVALRKCPFLNFAPPRFDAYKAISHQIRDIFFEYTDQVEPLSLDEAFLDVTTNKENNPSATNIAKEIKNKIYKTTGLTASAGIASNKFLAKIASDIQKPDGLTLILPDMALDFLKKLPIEKFFGVGKVTAQKMKSLGINYGSDLFNYTEFELNKLFGKTGSFYYNVVRGIDDRPVVTSHIQKSVGAENTFKNDIIDIGEIVEKLKIIIHRVTSQLKKNNISGKTITLKIKYYDFVISTRSKTLNIYTHDYDKILQTILELLNFPQKPLKPIRLIGVSLSNLDNLCVNNMGIQLCFDFSTTDN